LQELHAVIVERSGGAYLLTVSDDLRPHAVQVAVQWDGDLLAAEVGKRSAANATARPNISLLYSVRTAGDYSLIIDGTAHATGSSDAPRLLITPTKAVLHRPAVTPDSASPCSADCVPLLPPTRPGS
jgi:hypothetical protein